MSSPSVDEVQLRALIAAQIVPELTKNLVPNFAPNTPPDVMQEVADAAMKMAKAIILAARAP